MKPIRQQYISVPKRSISTKYSKTNSVWNNPLPQQPEDSPWTSIEPYAGSRPYLAMEFGGRSPRFQQQKALEQFRSDPKQLQEDRLCLSLSSEKNFPPTAVFFFTGLEKFKKWGW